VGASLPEDAVAEAAGGNLTAGAVGTAPYSVGGSRTARETPTRSLKAKVLGWRRYRDCAGRLKFAGGQRGPLSPSLSENAVRD
jgi:hypothetical protein